MDNNDIMTKMRLLFEQMQTLQNEINSSQTQEPTASAEPAKPKRRRTTIRARLAKQLKITKPMHDRLMLRGPKRSLKLTPEQAKESLRLFGEISDTDDEAQTNRAGEATNSGKSNGAQLPLPAQTVRENTSELAEDGAKARAKPPNPYVALLSKQRRGSNRADGLFEDTKGKKAPVLPKGPPEGLQAGVDSNVSSRASSRLTNRSKFSRGSEADVEDNVSVEPSAKHMRTFKASNSLPERCGTCLLGRYCIKHPDISTQRPSEQATSSAQVAPTNKFSLDFAEIPHRLVLPPGNITKLETTVSIAPGSTDKLARQFQLYAVETGKTVLPSGCHSFRDSLTNTLKRVRLYPPTTYVDSIATQRLYRLHKSAYQLGHRLIALTPISDEDNRTRLECLDIAAFMANQSLRQMFYLNHGHTGIGPNWKPTKK